jgi:hypothetical protein
MQITAAPLKGELLIVGIGNLGDKPDYRLSNPFVRTRHEGLGESDAIGRGKVVGDVFHGRSTDLYVEWPTCRLFEKECDGHPQDASELFQAA